MTTGTKTNGILRVFSMRLTPKQEREIGDIFNRVVHDGTRGYMIGIQPNLPKGNMQVFILTQAFGDKLNELIIKERNK